MTQPPPKFTPDSEFAELETPRGPNAGSLAITALARFEFEAGKGNEGTKILMVEWKDDDISRSSKEGSWHVSWPEKTTVLPAHERPNEHTRRFYFLLPPNTTIPPVLTLSYEPTDTTVESTLSSKAREALQLNPLPAIFPPELGATGRAAGKKGVLHTIWAKKRLRVLESEIRDECLNNAEGVALHMAVQEKEWIERNFGVTAHGVESVASSHDSSNTSSLYPTGPTTPVSPVSGRKLTDKLKGLKLQTSEKDLSVNDRECPILTISEHLDIDHKPDPTAASLLSPQSPDVAVSSFNSFHNITNPAPPSNLTMDTNTTPTPSSHVNSSDPEPRRPVALHPPETIQEAQQTTEPSGFATLNAMSTIARTTSAESSDELFAKALSPRSPDLPRSPFSFA